MQPWSRVCAAARRTLWVPSRPRGPNKVRQVLSSISIMWRWSLLFVSIAHASYLCPFLLPFPLPPPPPLPLTLAVAFNRRLANRSSSWLVEPVGLKTPPNAGLGYAAPQTRFCMPLETVHKALKRCQEVPDVSCYHHVCSTCSRLVCDAT